ncbi:sensor histidine kinase [Planobacterium oryzisoli]|uniref:histidine kinase n=1 Tax=Planobacterium oryzisoli TaxID=2771435 RepID=A0A930YXF0_9FLAO|nr:PAS domain-containing protein [Planobacterium oryzisoli]MBF5028031.1 PAS domain-containing protein [Planobacterium oryzisoli]
MKNYLKQKVNYDSLASLFSQAPVALCMLMGEDLVIDTANQQILELWGKSSDIIGLPIIEGIPELKGQEFPDILKGVLRTGKSFRGDKVQCFLNREGVMEECFFDFVYSPIRDSGNTIIGVSVVATEVTSQVLSERKLSESELRFKELLLKADVSTAIYRGEDLVIEVANDKMLATWGKDASVIGRPLREALPELVGQPFFDLLLHVYRTGETYAATEDRVDLMTHGVLETFYYNFTYKAIRNSKGEIYAILNMAVNVTELVKAKHRLQESEAKYRNLSEAMPHIVWTANNEGQFTYFNGRLSEYFEVDRANPTQVSFAHLIHPEDLSLLELTWREASEKKKGFDFEYRVRNEKTGEYIWFLSRAVPEFDSKGEVIQWIGSSIDINELKTLQSQKDTFLGIASHELKTPLTSIKIYAQVLERALKKAGDPKSATYAKKMDEQVNKLNSLIGDLLDVTKISAGKMQINEDMFDFKQLVDEVIEEQQLSCTHTIINNSEPVGMVFADRNRIAQVVTNLLSNAIKYSPGAEKVLVYTKVSSQGIQFCVQDFGIGMPEDKQHKVFDQYYRVSGDEQHTFPGLGLGLFIASQIIQRSGGKIWVRSVLGKGSTFCFSLPAIK